MYNWLVVSIPLKNMSSSVGMMTFPIYHGKIRFMFQTTNQLCNAAMSRSTNRVSSIPSSPFRHCRHGLNGLLDSVYQIIYDYIYIYKYDGNSTSRSLRQRVHEDSPCPTLTSAGEGRRTIWLSLAEPHYLLGSENGGYLNTGDGGEKDD